MRTHSLTTACYTKKHGASASQGHKNFPFTKLFQRAVFLRNCYFIATIFICSLYYCLGTMTTVQPHIHQGYTLKRSTKRKTVQVVGWIAPQLKAELERIAQQEK